MPTSTITNTVTDLNGTPIEGVVVVARLRPGPAFRRDSFSEIASEDSTTTNSSGNWAIALEEQSNIDPDGAYYEIEEQIPDASGGVKVWAIQVGANDATLYASLVATLPTVTGPTYLTQESADARYLAAGSLGFGSPSLVSTTTSAGISTAASRADHQHALDAALAGNALVLTSGVLHWVPDDSTLEVSADQGRIKDGGVTLVKLSTQVRGGFLHYPLYQLGVR